MTISRRALLAGLAATPAALAAGTTLRPSPASAAEGTLVVLDEGRFTLRYRNTTTVGTKPPYAEVIDGLHTAGALPWASVDAVLDSANRAGADHPMNYTAFAQGWVWQSGDNTDPNWYPQGITTSADYHEDGLYNGRRVILVAWYDHSDAGKGARVSFVDMTDGNAPAYRHVLLVEPVYTANGGAGLPDFQAVDVHAGGIVWYGDLLYVVDSINSDSAHRGIRVFDTSKMMKVSSTGDTTTIGRQADGTYTAHNYLYVLPQVAAYDAAVANADTGNYAPVQWSCVGLDRSGTDTIVVAEYADDVPDGAAKGTRIFRWKLDYTTRLLAATSGVATASYAARVDIDQMQGATSYDGTYYISRSNYDNPGNLITWQPGSLIHENNAPPHTEDVSYDQTYGRVWSLTEEPGERWVFSRTASGLY